MTLLIVDASVVLAREDPDDANHAHVTTLLERTDPVATLDLTYYEVTNVAVRAWKDPAALKRLLERLDAIAADGGIFSVSPELISAAVGLADRHGISVYDAAYVAAAEAGSGVLASCDIRDLVSRGLARSPADLIGA